MDLMPTSDQEAIQASVRAFLENELPMERVRRLAGAGADEYASLWKAAAELGFFGLGLPEAQGGAGYAITEEMVLFEELGRALAPGPWLGSVLAARALGARRESALAEARERVVAGDWKVAIVEAEGAGAETAIRDGRATGGCPWAADAAVADAFLLLSAGGAWLVERGDGVEVGALPSMDPTRPIAAVKFDGAVAVRLVDAPEEAARLLRSALVLSCAEAVGAIQRTVEMSVAYAKVRTQFDRPIGSFQAVKHRCADMAVRAEAARSATIYAVVSTRDDAPDADFQSRVAKVLCANAFHQNAADNVQNHGGIGFTWECDAHLFVKRARSFDLAFGAKNRQLDRIVSGFRAA